MDDAPESTAGDADAADALAYAPRPAAVASPMRHPLALAGSGLVGVAMGAAEIVPGFSGGTVALVCGIYERLVANVRQGARMLSLVVRGRLRPAVRALGLIEWPFVLALLVGMSVSLVTLARGFGRLIEEQPIEMSATFLGLVLGAAAVATMQLRRPGPAHGLVVAVAAVLTFAGLGLTPGTISDPSHLVMFAGVSIAVCAWILPGVSGAFLLLLLGLYPAALEAVAERDLVLVGVMALGALAGLAAFSTLLNFLLARYHDVVLAAMIGLMIGSSRVLWPWPAGMGDPTLGPPEAGTTTLVIALAVGSFVAVWVFGLVAGALDERLRSRR